MWYIDTVNNRGQNVVEYILVVTAVVLVFVAVVTNGSFRGAVKKNLDSVVPAIDQASNSLHFR